MRSRFALSCIVPVFNEGAHVAQFLESLHRRAATLTPELEIVVVNDGSMDNSAAADYGDAEFSEQMRNRIAIPTTASHMRPAALAVASGRQLGIDALPSSRSRSFRQR
jgi:hypothetical protein